MSAFTDRLYNQWRRSNGGSGTLLTTGRPARPGLSQGPQKAKPRAVASANAASVHNPIDRESSHGISKV